MPDADDFVLPVNSPKCKQAHPIFNPMCGACVTLALTLRREAENEVMAANLAETARPVLTMNDIIQRKRDGFSKALWGDDNQALARDHIPWSIWGHDGRGKTTVAIQYVRTRLGWTDEPEMWGMPVALLPTDESVLYLAMDKSAQLVDAHARGFAEPLPPEQSRRLLVYEGLPPALLWTTTGLGWLESLVEEANARLLVIDTMKDLINTNDVEQVLGYSRMLNRLSPVMEILSLGHPVKPKGRFPDVEPRLSNIPGHGGVYQGHGSIVFLNANEPGLGVIKVTQAKATSVGGAIPPFHITLDRDTGQTERLDEEADITDKNGRTRTVPITARWEKPLIQWMTEQEGPEGRIPSKAIQAWFIENEVEVPEGRVSRLLADKPWVEGGGTGWKAWWRLLGGSG